MTQTTKNFFFFALLTLGVFGGIAWVLLLRPFAMANSRNALSCDDQEFSFGRLPVIEGVASGAHVFKIKNNTDKDIRLFKAEPSCWCAKISPFDKTIPAHGMREITLFLAQPETDVYGRQLEVAIVAEDKTVQPLKLKITSWPGFSDFLSNNQISFGKIFRNDFTREENEFILFSSNENEIKHLAKKIDSDKPTIVEVSKGMQKNEKITDRNGISYFHRVPFQVSLKIKPDSPLGLDSAKVFVETQGGIKKEVIVTWEVGEKSMFDVNDLFYLIQLQPLEKRRFTVQYYTNIGGKVKTIKTTTPMLLLDKTEESENELKLYLLYEAKTNFKPDDILGEVIVETEDGKEHRLKVVAS
jgi:hypothetical protein